MLNKPKKNRTYSSIMAELKLYDYIPNDSKDIPLGFIHEEAIKIRNRKSLLSTSIREFVLGMDMIDTKAKEVEAKRAIEEPHQTEDVVLAGGA